MLLLSCWLPQPLTARRFRGVPAGGAAVSLAAHRDAWRESASGSVESDFLQTHGLQPRGSSVQGILQARILEWIAISFSRGSSHPRD